MVIANEDPLLFGGDITRDGTDIRPFEIVPTTDILRAKSVDGGQYLVHSVEYKDRVSMITNKLLSVNDNSLSRYEAVYDKARQSVFLLEKNSSKFSIFDLQTERFTSSPNTIPYPFRSNAFSFLYLNSNGRAKVILTPSDGSDLAYFKDLVNGYIETCRLTIKMDNGEDQDPETWREIPADSTATYLEMGNKIIIYEMEENNGTEQNVFMLNLHSMVLERLWCESHDISGHFPKARRGCSLHVTRDENKLIMYGGTELRWHDLVMGDSPQSAFSDVWMFCLASRKWQHIDPWVGSHPALSPLPCAFASSVMSESKESILGLHKIFISGGAPLDNPLLLGHSDRFFTTVSVMSSEMKSTLTRLKSFTEFRNAAFSDVDIEFQDVAET